jgi:hypothetical protein
MLDNILPRQQPSLHQIDDWKGTLEYMDTCSIASTCS